jgi:hypothetical protein
MSALRWAAVALLVGMPAVAWCAQVYARARGGAERTEARLVAAARAGAELMELRRAAPPELRRGAPEPGIAARLGEAVARAGVPRGAVRAVTPEAETRVGGEGAGLRRAAARVTLEPVTVPQLGRVLQEWRTAEPSWRVAGLDLAALAGKASGPDPLLRCTVTLEYLYGVDGKDGRKE